MAGVPTETILRDRGSRRAETIKEQARPMLVDRPLRTPLLPIAGGEDPPDPDPADPGNPTPPADPVAELRQKLAERETEAGNLRGELASLRSRLDAAEVRASYVPTPDTGRPGELGKPDPLREYIIQGIPEAERVAPTIDTFVQVVRKMQPVYAQYTTDALTQHEQQRQLDEEFWVALGQKWDKPWRTLRKRHAKIVDELTKMELFNVPPNPAQGVKGVLKSEFQNNPDRAVEHIITALEKRLAGGAEDVPPTKPGQRAVTGEPTRARLPAAEVEANRKEMDDLLKATGQGR